MARSGKFVVNRLEHPQKAATTRLDLIQRLELALSLLHRLLVGFVTFYMCWMCLRLNVREIPWHALLCTLGQFVCLTSEGLLAHYRGNGWTQSCQRVEKTRTHWMLQLCGSSIGLAGIAIKVYLEQVHFHSLHGKLGLATFVLCLISLATGTCTAYSHELSRHLQPQLNKALHSALGLTTFVLAMLSMCYAFDTDVFLEYSLDAARFANFRLLLKTLIVLILLLGCYGPVWCLIYSKLWKLF